MNARIGLLAVLAACSDVPSTITDAGVTTPDAPTADASSSCELQDLQFTTDLVVPRDPTIPSSTASIRRVERSDAERPDLFVSEPLHGDILWFQGSCPGCDPVELTDGLNQPVRVDLADVDADGDRDIVVADIGSLGPSNDLVGRVVLLENDGGDTFTATPLLTDRRIACAETGDLDGDGDLDIAVCVFGHEDGRVLWLERQAAGTYATHVIENLPGAIHAFPFDADGDGDLDIAVAISQLTEAVRLYRNDGAGNFSIETLFQADVEYYGLAGIELVDLDRDGDTDILVANGDYLDYEVLVVETLRELHGIAWLENDGDGNFTHHDIHRMLGAYAARAADFDGDCDLDLAVASFDPNNLQSETLSLSWLENDGAQNFSLHELHDMPSILAIEIMDWDADGTPDILAGSMAAAGGGGADARLRVYPDKWR